MAPDTRGSLISVRTVSYTHLINASDIEKNKIRHDLGITYDVDVLRLIQEFRDKGLYVGSVVITRYTGQPSADLFKSKLENLGIRVYRHYPIEGYPNNISHIVSDEGYGKNDYIETVSLIHIWWCGGSWVPLLSRAPAQVSGSAYFLYFP